MKKPILLMFLYAISIFSFEGYWYTKGRESVIEIKQTGSTYSGRIVWLKESLDREGNPWKDSENPKKSLRNRPLLGLPLLWKFRKKKKSLVGGRIYDPESGKTYSCTISKKGNRLAVRGFIGVSLLGRTEFWTPCQELPGEVAQ